MVGVRVDWALNMLLMCRALMLSSCARACANFVSMLRRTSRGCLPHHDGIADLLRAVKVPSLPTQIVHEPISRLLFLSARYEKFFKAFALTTGLTTSSRASTREGGPRHGVADQCDMEQSDRKPFDLGILLPRGLFDEDEEKEEEKGEKANKSLSLI